MLQTLYHNMLAGTVVALVLACVIGVLCLVIVRQYLNLRKSKKASDTGESSYIIACSVTNILSDEQVLMPEMWSMMKLFFLQTPPLPLLLPLLLSLMQPISL